MPARLLRAITGREQMQQITCAVARLLDHLVGANKQIGRHCQTERVGGLEVDDKLDFGGLLDR